MDPRSSTPSLDVRAVAPRDRHPLIFATFDALDAGESFELVNDHDPKPLFYQFQAERPDEVAWEYLERGPETWRVQVGRRAIGGATARGEAATGEPASVDAALPVRPHRDDGNGGHDEP